MTHRELEDRLYTALSHAAPNDVDGVLARCAPRTGGIVPITGRKRPRRWFPLALAACLALVAVGGGGVYYLQNGAVASVVCLEVNPSVELTVNRQERVLSATPTNQDAVDILEGMDLTGSQVNVAMNAIVGALLTKGYVDELANSILITVEDPDAARGARLQQSLTAQADAVLAGAQVNGAILSQTIQNSDALRQLSQTYGISAGKAALIQTIVEGSAGLHTFDELVGLSINELNLLYSSQADPGSGSTPQGVPGTGGTQDAAVGSTLQSSGQASDGAYIGLESALAAALAHAGVSSSQATLLESDYDYENGRMTYELEFYVGGTEYEYDIDALTGAVIQSKWEGTPPSSGQPAVPDSSGASAGNTAQINAQQAQDIALAHAGLSQDQVSRLKVEGDWDDGRLEYEVEFQSGGWEYEYKIDGTTGAILEFERDH